MVKLKLSKNMVEISMNAIPSKVERWYDRHTKSWVIQLKDQNNNQIGNATYVYSKYEAISEENRLIKEYNITQ